MRGGSWSASKRLGIFNCSRIFGFATPPSHTRASPFSIKPAHYFWPDYFLYSESHEGGLACSSNLATRLFAVLERASLLPAWVPIAIKSTKRKITSPVDDNARSSVRSHLSFHAFLVSNYFCVISGIEPAARDVSLSNFSFSPALPSQFAHSGEERATLVALSLPPSRPAAILQCATKCAVPF